MNVNAFNLGGTNASVPFSAKIGGVYFFKWKTRGDGNTVMAASLSMNEQVFEPHFLKGLFWEFPILAFNLLQADNVRFFSLGKSCNIWCAETDGIYVPGDDFHAAALKL